MFKRTPRWWLYWIFSGLLVFGAAVLIGFAPFLGGGSLIPLLLPSFAMSAFQLKLAIGLGMTIGGIGLLHFSWRGGEKAHIITSGLAFIATALAISPLLFTSSPLMAIPIILTSFGLLHIARGIYQRINAIKRLKNIAAKKVIFGSNEELVPETKSEVSSKKSVISNLSELAKALESSPDIEELDLSNVAIKEKKGKSSLQILLQQIYQTPFPKLKKLNLSNHSTEVQHESLDNYLIAWEMQSNLGILLRNCPQLEELTLNNCRLTDDKVVGILGIFPKNLPLMRLNLQNNSLDELFLGKEFFLTGGNIFEQFRKKRSLSLSPLIIDVSGNPISPQTKSCLYIKQDPSIAPEEDKSENTPTDENSPIKLFSQLTDSLKQGKLSIIQRDQSLPRRFSHKKWLLYLYSPPGSIHVHVYIEGVRKNGQTVQSFMDLDGVGKVAVRNDSLAKEDALHSTSEHIALAAEIDAQIGENILKENVTSHEKSYNFCFFSSVATHLISHLTEYSPKTWKRHNCLTWAIAALEKQGIPLPQTDSVLPNSVVQAVLENEMEGIVPKITLRT